MPFGLRSFFHSRTLSDFVCPSCLSLQVGAPHAASQASALGWVDKVCSLVKEKERNLYAGPDFVVTVDTKWANHGAFFSAPNGEADVDGAAAPEAVDRKAWHGAPWTSGLYLLAIAKDPKLMCVHSVLITTVYFSLYRGYAVLFRLRTKKASVISSHRRHHIMHRVLERKKHCIAYW